MAPPSSTTMPTIPSRSPPRSRPRARPIAGPIVAVVQPHRYTRLRDTFEQFATCLNDADVAMIAPVYAAGEQPIEGINRDTYAEALRAHGHRNVITIDGEDDLAAVDRRLYVKPGGAIVGLGAGSITGWMHNLPEEAGGAGVMMTRPCACFRRCAAPIARWRAAEGPGLVPRRRSGGSPVPSRRCRRSGDFPCAPSRTICASA